MILTQSGTIRLISTSLMLAFLASIWVIPSVNAQDEPDDEAMARALNQASRGRSAEFKRLSEQYKDHPLHLDLSYRHLNARISRLKDEEVAEFLQRAEQSSLALRLRKPLPQSPGP